VHCGTNPFYVAFLMLTHLLRWWIAVADFIIYAGSVDNSYIDANPILHRQLQGGFL
jgi:hypothetical protein